jgi:hypothetical protein
VKSLSLDQRRDDVAGVRRRHDVSELRAMKALGYNRSTIRYRRKTEARLRTSRSW